LAERESCRNLRDRARRAEPRLFRKGVHLHCTSVG
jgi:hypothetical protein